MSSVSGKTVTNFHTGSQILPSSLLSSQGKRREGEPATINPKLLSKQPPPPPPLAPSALCALANMSVQCAHGKDLLDIFEFQKEKHVQICALLHGKIRAKKEDSLFFLAVPRLPIWASITVCIHPLPLSAQPIF